ncbi:hypothetical protein BGW37DRAFT_505256 [Umbelopsis sp. PMI_123]|nr:hypothetical protein BGW37DRAFT_505256 [Umbelopsis sp. PMI_123]
MSQQPTTENRAQRRAREREEKKAAKRFANFNSESKPLPTASVSSKATLNNKKKHRKSIAGSTKPSIVPNVSTSPGSKISAVVGKSPCKLIMVESSTAPSVAVQAAYNVKPTVAPAKTTTKKIEKVQQTAPKSIEPVVVELPKSEPEVVQTPQKENTQEEKNGGNSSVVDPMVDNVDTPKVSEDESKIEPESSSEEVHSSTATPEKPTIASPACNDTTATTDGKPEPNKSAVTLVGNEESEKPSAPQQQANTPAPTSQTVKTSAETPSATPSSPTISDTTPATSEKKTPTVLDIFKKEKSKKVSELGWHGLPGVAETSLFLLMLCTCFHETNYQSVPQSKSDSKKESKKKAWQFWKK